MAHYFRGYFYSICPDRDSVLYLRLVPYGEWLSMYLRQGFGLLFKISPRWWGHYAFMRLQVNKKYIWRGSNSRHSVNKTDALTDWATDAEDDDALNIIKTYILFFPQRVNSLRSIADNASDFYSEDRGFKSHRRFFYINI